MLTSFLVRLIKIKKIQFLKARRRRQNTRFCHAFGVPDRGWPRKLLERRVDPNTISHEQFKVWDFEDFKLEEEAQTRGQGLGPGLGARTAASGVAWAHHGPALGYHWSSP
jgi:hypothetical protein